MITCEMILTAQQSILDDWGDAGKRVIEEAAKVNPFNGNVKEWLKHCTCCGGNWGGMFLSGLQVLYPAVYKAIPDDMGLFAMADILNILILCGVDTSV